MWAFRMGEFTARRGYLVQHPHFKDLETED